jgi:hypothetical protein
MAYRPARNTLLWLPSMSSRVSGNERGCGAAIGEQRRMEESAAAYPVARPDRGDARFTYGLALDVAAVLARHGYPQARAAADLVRVQQFLFELIYGAG